MSISHTGEGACSHTPALARGMRDGIPVGLGYLAVAFSLGIAARNAGLNAFQGFLVSLLNNASAANMPDSPPSRQTPLIWKSPS